MQKTSKKFSRFEIFIIYLHYEFPPCRYGGSSFGRCVLRVRHIGTTPNRKFGLLVKIVHKIGAVFDYWSKLVHKCGCLPAFSTCI